MHDVCVIQHMLRDNVISKASNHFNIILLLSIVTYFITKIPPSMGQTSLFDTFKTSLQLGTSTTKMSTTQPQDMSQPIFLKSSITYTTPPNLTTSLHTSLNNPSMFSLVRLSVLLNPLGRQRRRMHFDMESHQLTTTSSKMLYQSVLPTQR